MTISQDMIIKLLLSIILGGIIGIEREISGKYAGFRTHILICFGATLMSILSFEFVKGTSGDPSRIAAQVITGIGFIGAGTIIQARGEVRGLTTAASLWAVAGLGLAIGTGNYFISVISTFIILFTLIIFRFLENLISPKYSVHLYEVKTKKTPEVVNEIKKIISQLDLNVESFEIKRKEDFFHVSVSYSGSQSKDKQFLKNILELKEIEEITHRV
ncbi:MAG: MgtC/SapB family protein [Acidobacteriota bacterium]